MKNSKIISILVLGMIIIIAGLFLLFFPVIFKTSPIMELAKTHCNEEDVEAVYVIGEYVQVKTNDLNSAATYYPGDGGQPFVCTGEEADNVSQECIDIMLLSYQKLICSRNKLQPYIPDNGAYQISYNERRWQPRLESDSVVTFLEPDNSVEVDEIAAAGYALGPQVSIAVRNMSEISGVASPDDWFNANGMAEGSEFLVERAMVQINEFDLTRTVTLAAGAAGEVLSYIYFPGEDGVIIINHYPYDLDSDQTKAFEQMVETFIPAEGLIEGDVAGSRQLDDFGNDTDQTPVEPPPDKSGLNALCYLEPDVGPCEASMPRYYFDQVTGCTEFKWGGCKGVVPFEEISICDQICGNI